MALQIIRNEISGARALSRDDVATADMPRPAGVNRRELLTLALPQQRILPKVDITECAGHRCALCAEVCPQRAITFEDGALCLDGAACDGCGVCLGACPYPALACEDYGAPALEAALRDALAQSEVLLLTDRDIQLEGIGAIRLPHPGLLSPWLLLRALTLGARGVLIDFEDATVVAPKVAFVRDLLGLMGDDAARLVMLARGDDPAPRIAALRQLGESRITAVTGATGGGAALTALMHQIDLPAAGVIRGEYVPFGWLDIDAAKCSGCGLCADICPTAALEFRAEAGASLSFRHDLCVACGRCARHCPEQCLGLTRGLDLARWDAPPAVLHSSLMQHCPQCGAAVAPRATIETLQARLVTAGIKDVAYLELCAECKLKRSSAIL